MGTTAGIGIALNTPIYLKAGDRIEVEIERIGLISNAVVPA
jgi:2-keto-4-pentenoate hydratase/2-oxohepta-3-ene-1,7-dioic acid hydratase in catechol pathway